MIARLFFAGVTAAVLVIFGTAFLWTRTPQGYAVGTTYFWVAFICLARARYPESSTGNNFPEEGFARRTQRPQRAGSYQHWGSES